MGELHPSFAKMMQCNTCITVTVTGNYADFVLNCLNKQTLTCSLKADMGSDMGMSAIMCPVVKTAL